MADLGAYLLAAGQRVRESAIFDCCAYPADWCIENGWPDPMEKWRFAYENESEALDIVEAAGGLLALFIEGMGSAGIPKSDSFALGDVGVIRVGEHEAGGIFAGKRWTFAADRGFAASSLDPSCILATWRVSRG